LAAGQQTLISHAGIHLEADQVTVARGTPDAQKAGETSACRVDGLPQHLVEHHVESEVAMMQSRDAVAGRVRQRTSQSVATQIGEFSRMVPATKLGVAERGREVWRDVERVGKFRERERAALANQKVDPPARVVLDFR